MGYDEVVVTQISVKAPSPVKDQPTTFPYLDWSAMQNLPMAAFGKPYAAMYPNAAGFLRPFMALIDTWCKNTGLLLEEKRRHMGPRGSRKLQFTDVFWCFHSSDGDIEEDSERS